MGLNKSKGHMYGFVTHTWNTVKGACSHNCSYCYMKRWGKQSEVYFDETELKTDLGSGNFIFVGSSNDMFAEDIPDEWIMRTLEHCNDYDNKYLFQSKNAVNMVKYDGYMPENTVFCTTIESDISHPGVTDAPNLQSRFDVIDWLTWQEAEVMITIEPVMAFSNTFADTIIKTGCKKVNIGANTSRVNLPEPTTKELAELIDKLRFNGVEVIVKKNLKRLLGKELFDRYLRGWELLPGHQSQPITPSCSANLLSGGIILREGKR